jgi:hypothetical protein
VPAFSAIWYVIGRRGLEARSVRLPVDPVAAEPPEGAAFCDLVVATVPAATSAATTRSAGP